MLHEVIRVVCSRCGSLIGSATGSGEATVIYREHIAECEVDP